jgi:hypothetical protein
MVYGYRFVHPEGAQHTVITLVALANGDMAFTVDGVLHHGGKDGFTVVPLPFRLNQVSLDESGDLLLLSRESSLFVLRDGKPAPLAPPEDILPTDILGLHNAGGAVWLRVTDGAFRRQGDRWVRELRGRELYSLTITKDGRRYGATRLPLEERGLWSWTADGESTRVTGAVADLIYAIVAAEDGRLLVLHESGDILWYDNEGGGWSHIDPLPEPMHDVKNATFRRNGDLVLATARGIRIHRTAVTAWERWHTPAGGGRNRLDEILPASNGDIWLGTDAGVEVRHPDGSISWYEEAVGKDLRIITGLEEDEQGGIWVSSGAYWEGAFRYHEGEWRFYGSEDGLMASRIHRINRDAAGRLWFLGLHGSTGSTRNSTASIATYHKGKFGTFDLEHELAERRVYSFSEGEDGALWFSGLSGIGRVLDGNWTHWDVDSGLRYRRRSAGRTLLRRQEEWARPHRSRGSALLLRYQRWSHRQ